MSFVEEALRGLSLSHHDNRFPHLPMKIRPAFSAFLSTALLALPACAGPNSASFFPRMHPLFAGLDETKVRHGVKTLLAEAKADFQLARHGKAPQYAKYTSTIPYTHSRVFEGNGYCITLVKKDIVDSFYEGPKIVLNSSITGGKPYAYDEVEVTGD
jgi:hypothetical protein